MAEKKEVKNEIENKTKKTTANKSNPKKNSESKNETKKKTENKTVAKKTTNNKESNKKQNNDKSTKKVNDKLEKKATTKKTVINKEDAKKENTEIKKEKNATKKIEKAKKITEIVVSKKENTEIKADSEKIISQENEKDNNKILGIFEKIVILVAVALVFSLLGYFIGSNHNNKTDYPTDTKELQVFIEQYNKIIDEYYEEVDKDALIKGAISGMLSTLDGYSQVIDDSSNNFIITLEGTYEGLGIEIINNAYNEIEIYNVYDDTPAKKAGIKIGDIVTKINDTDLKNVSTTDFVDMIGKTDDIKLTLLRNSKEITVNLKKEKIVLKSVSYEMLENNIGYIKVDLFANNTYEQFKTALESLEKQNMKSLIIDLRDNTGGHLSTVKDMISLFLDSSHVIYQTESKTETVKYYSTGNKNKKYSIVILQNEVSASASEIMASALSEQLNAYIIGKNSFGKGTVQQLETLEGIGQYKFTTKKWLTSKGVWLNDTGLAPDLEVSLDQEYYINPTKENDSQLKEAIKYLNKK